MRWLVYAIDLWDTKTLSHFGLQATQGLAVIFKVLDSGRTARVFTPQNKSINVTRQWSAVCATVATSGGATRYTSYLAACRPDSRRTLAAARRSPSTGLGQIAESLAGIAQRSERVDVRYAALLVQATPILARSFTRSFSLRSSAPSDFV